MDESHRAHVDQFERCVQRFQRAWGSVDVRVGWVEGSKVDTVVFLKVILDARKSNELGPTPPDPSVGPFKAARCMLPAKRLKDVLDHLRSDEVRVGKKVLLIGQFLQDQFKRSANPNYTFQPAGDRHSRPGNVATARLEEHTRRVYEITSGAVSDSDLERAWRSLPTPYRDLEDVLGTFFDQPTPPLGQRYGFAIVEARIPLWLDPISGFYRRRLRVLVRSATSLRKSLRVGIISKTSTGLDRRIGIEGRSLRWRTSGRNSFAIVSQDAVDLKSAEIFLSHKGELIAVLSRENQEIQSDNRAIAIHQVFDNGLRRMDEGLKGQGKGRKQDNFERAIQWLLHSCGLRTVAYGGGNTDNEIDLVAEWSEGRTVVAVECTTNSSDLGRKMAVLHRRSNELEMTVKGWKVLPVLATSLGEDQVTRTSREMAYNDRIVLLTGAELVRLKQMALKCAEPRDVMEYLKEGGAAEPADGADIASALGRQSQRSFLRGA